MQRLVASQRPPLPPIRMPTSVPAPAPAPHTWVDDVQALATGVLTTALGISLMAHAGLLTGGLPGLAFLVHYAGGWPLGPVFFVLNLPFYALAYTQLGARFAWRTLLSGALLAAAIQWMPGVLRFGAVEPLFASAMGGLLIGTGLLVLFRHNTSLGGFNVLALWLQRRRGWPAGAVQMVLDCAIVLAALFVTDTARVLQSIVGAVVLNLVLSFNHRPGRYRGA